MEMLYKTAETVEKVGAGKLAASVWYKGELLSVGINKLKTHPLQARFCSNPERIYLHAETDAISRAVKHYVDISGSDLYVARVKNKHLPGLAKPCSGCISCASHFGIRNIYYSTDDGTVERVSL